MSYILDPSTYKPKYVLREDVICRHCAENDLPPIRTNAYLFRCNKCWGYW